MDVGARACVCFTGKGRQQVLRALHASVTYRSRVSCFVTLPDVEGLLGATKEGCRDCASVQLGRRGCVTLCVVADPCVAAAAAGCVAWLSGKETREDVRGRPRARVSRAPATPRRHSQAHTTPQPAAYSSNRPDASSTRTESARISARALARRLTLLSPERLLRELGSQPQPSTGQRSAKREIGGDRASFFGAPRPRPPALSTAQRPLSQDDARTGHAAPDHPSQGGDRH
jgi:hypothetical protein